MTYQIKRKQDIQVYNIKKSIGSETSTQLQITVEAIPVSDEHKMFKKQKNAFFITYFFAKCSYLFVLFLLDPINVKPVVFLMSACLLRKLFR